MIVFNEIDVGVRRDVDTRDEIIGVVALLDPPFLYRNVAVQCIADAHDRGTLQLRAHTVWIDHGAAIDRHVEPWDRDLAVIADGDMRDDSHIA